jgi:hypothetical protein
VTDPPVAFSLARFGDGGVERAFWNRLSIDTRLAAAAFGIHAGCRDRPPDTCATKRRTQSQPHALPL